MSTTEPPPVLPPPPAPKKPPAAALLVALGIIGVIVWLSVANQDDGPNMRPIDSNASVTHLSPQPVGGVDFEVLTCEVEYGFATAQISVTSTAAYSYVGFSGDYTNAAGEVVGQGIGNLSDVVPGQTYKTDVIYSLSGGNNSGGTCTVRLDTTL